MFASVLIPDNATCCEMTFKLTINTPTPYHIEITNINVMEGQTASSNNIHITWMDGNNELDPYSGKINSGVATDICSELISLSPGTYTFSCSETTHWMGYAIYNYDTEVCEDGNDTGELSITFTLTENKKVRLGANVEECERTAFSLIREP